MLTLPELNNILTAGPGASIEILTPALATVERLAQTLIAFANGQGGILVVRLDPASSDGDTDAERLRDRAADAMLASAPHLILPLPYVLPAGVQSPSALVIEAPSGLPHLYSLDGRHFVRDGAHNVVLAGRSLRNLLLARGEGTWEALCPSGCSSDDLDWQKIQDYGARVMSANRHMQGIEDLLLHRGCLARKGKSLKPTSAGLLLFGIDPQSWVRGAEVLAVRYTGTSIGDACTYTRQTIAGTLPDQIRDAESFIAESHALDRKPAYPAVMLHETIVNAVAHRDYRLGGNQIHLLVFADRIEVLSPGRLPGHVTLENLVCERYSRNEAIMQVLSDMGFVERLGHGIDRILSSAHECGLPVPMFKETDGGFVVTLYCRPAPACRAGNGFRTSVAIEIEPLTMAQNERIDKMLAFIKAHGQISNREYQELCPGVTTESLRRDFLETVGKGLVLRVGDKRGTYYILKHPANNV